MHVLQGSWKGNLTQAKFKQLEIEAGDAIKAVTVQGHRSETREISLKIHEEVSVRRDGFHANATQINAYYGSDPGDLTTLKAALIGINIGEISSDFNVVLDGEIVKRQASVQQGMQEYVEEGSSSSQKEEEVTKERKEMQYSWFNRSNCTKVVAFTGAVIMASVGVYMAINGASENAVQKKL